MLIRSFFFSYVVLTLFSGSLFAQNKSSRETEKGWELSLGAEGLSFYGTDEGGLSLSKNPFNEGRATMGAAFSVGRWVSPSLMLRTKWSGYWGRAIVSNLTEDNSSRYFSVQEQILVDVLDLLKGHSGSSFYKLYPFTGIGFSRNCSYNLNSAIISAGLKNSFKLNDLFALHAELGWSYAGHKNKYANGYHLFSAEVGLTFHLGKLHKRIKNPNYIYKDYGVRNYHHIARRSSFKDSLLKVVIERNVPRDMVLINRGSITIGEGIRDSLMYTSNPSKTISVDDFWMDATEVTNGMYREFVNDVIKTTALKRCGEKINKQTYNNAYNSLFYDDPISGSKKLNPTELIYKYEWFDEKGATLAQMAIDHENRFVYKDTAWVNETGEIVRKKLKVKYSGPLDFVNTYIVQVLPDTTVWIKDFPQSDMLNYCKYYFAHRDYEDYPVVGVSYEQAKAYCAWRTEKRKQQLGGSLGMEQPFRLPTEAEWEYAAKVYPNRVFPWDELVSRMNHEFLYANFQPEEGNYTKDGNLITSRVASYPSNGFGLYDMAGNVAEWTATPYTDMGVEDMNSVNPSLDGDFPWITVKGGSWKDPIRFIQCSERKSYHWSSQHAFIGFRCVRSVAIKPTEKTIIIR